MSRLDEGLALGLDLGTTFSCIGVYRNGGVEIIPNRNGEKVTPSIVNVLDEDNILIGEEAEEYLVRDYDSSIFAIKRFIGRNIKDKEVQKELQIENFPYKIIVDKNNCPQVEINKNNKKLYFSLEQISSFIIKKMVQSAEKYLYQKVDKLVITIPANFNDEQRKSTMKAAKLAGIEVIRIINEPTAAALAYGLQDKNNLNNNEKILVFDLGGGTFDVTILNIEKDQNNTKKFDVISTSSNKFLGGEDFDNKLVEYVLNDFCQNMHESKEKIKENKKLIKRLKVSCENIKRVLSVEEQTTLIINNFYNNKDILKIITRFEFEDLCKDLFEKLEKPLDDAIAKAKEKTKTEIKIGEIVLVGGSSRIPKIKKWLNEKFKCKINDIINPDETVAYGATLMAAKILIKRENLKLGFNLMDITPLSLGVEVVNEDENKDKKKEGSKMSVIIKRGESIPCTKIKNYVTVKDNQETVPIVIYEGENTYVKYNHKLKQKELTGLTKKPKGQVHIKIKFYIDVNGILNVTGTEIDENKNNSIELKIKDDMVEFSNEEIENLKKMNEKFFKNKKKDNLDYNYVSIKETLKDFQDAYNDCQDNDEKFEILINYNSVLEEFIDLFYKKTSEHKTIFENETIIEKYYIYIKELFISYEKTINMEQIKNNKEVQKNIIKKTKEYIKEFIKKSSGYLNNLVETIKNFPKSIFYEIIVFIMEEFNNCGKNSLKEMKKFCKHHTLIYFEKSKQFFEKYIEKIHILGICSTKLHSNCKLQKEISEIYIKDIHSGAILLCEDSLKSGKLIQTGTLFSLVHNGLIFGNKDEDEKNTYVLQNYEKVLAECQSKREIKDEKEKERIVKQEAICIANIIKIKYKLLSNNNYDTYIELGKRCLFLLEQLNIDENVEWVKEFNEMYNEIKDIYERTKAFNGKKDNIRKKYKNQFDEIDIEYNNIKNKNKNNKNKFIQYILETTPYDEYEEDKKNNILKNKNENDLIKYLSNKYHPDNYDFTDDENEQLRYCKIEYIDSLLNSLKS